MTPIQFNKLVKPDICQVFLLSSPCSLPASMFMHTWLVTNNFGVIHRWDVWSYKKRVTAENGHMTMDFYPPTVGLSLMPGSNDSLNISRFQSRLIGSVEGDIGSIAQTMVEFVEKRHLEYPFKYKYHYFPGPNSNTFVQWVLNHFPESGLKLPWSAMGKGWGV